jgi:4'-phosphopantetheinyl transferase
MDGLGWLSQRLADVPRGQDWLSERERQVLETLRLERRRADWRLGRWTAKRALGARLTMPPSRLEVLAAADGAPEAWLDGERLPVSISISHRGGRSLAVVADAPATAGCDLELIEPRSEAFIREWLAASEQRLVGDCAGDGRALLANAIWTAKEAAAKVRREGLRLDVRDAAVTLAHTPSEAGGWRRLRVDWDGGATTAAGWWRTEPGWVMAVAGEPACAPPRRLEPPVLTAQSTDRTRGSADV